METLLLTRNALSAGVALVEGRVGLVVVPRGRMVLALTLVVREGRTAEYSVIADSRRLAGLDVAVPPAV
ncbi:hypothetical protein [Catenulispora subtropica]|uniref:Uncharacterized protein n=1 Tax=Catenulispora subtropica TaxID=450798 RepID=A0ABP5DB41_9ACTN